VKEEASYHEPKFAPKTLLLENQSTDMRSGEEKDIE
tara:strand:- start:385 stop:492 length:108 start_codon:yes stop_codon:yes gene_type:complete